MAPGVVLLKGPRGGLFLMSEVPLYFEAMDNGSDSLAPTVTRVETKWGFPKIPHL